MTKKRKLLTIPSILVLMQFLVFSPSVKAQECSALISQGIYDIQSNASDLSTAASFASWFCDQKFSSSESANEFGASLGFPFKGIPLKFGFDSDSENFETWSSSFCSQVRHDQSLQSKVRSHVQTVNDGIVRAFNDCINADGLSVWLERTDDPRIFKFAARFTSPTQRAPFATIRSFDSGDNVQCKDVPVTIDRATFRTRCVRNGDSGVTIVVTADFDPRGGGKLSLPAVSPLSPPEEGKCSPATGVIDFDGDRCPDVYQIEGGQMVAKLSKNGRYVKVPANIPDYNANLGLWTAGDFDASGTSDLAHIVTKDAAGGPLDYVHVHFSAGNGLFHPPTKFDFRCAANPRCDYNTSLGNWSALDLNLDGKTDLLHDPNLPDRRKHCWYSMGDGHFQLRACPN